MNSTVSQTALSRTAAPSTREPRAPAAERDDGDVGLRGQLAGQGAPASRAACPQLSTAVQPERGADRVLPVGGVRDRREQRDRQRRQRRARARGAEHVCTSGHALDVPAGGQLLEQQLVARRRGGSIRRPSGWVASTVTSCANAPSSATRRSAAADPRALSRSPAAPEWSVSSAAAPAASAPPAAARAGRARRGPGRRTAVDSSSEHSQVQRLERAIRGGMPLRDVALERASTAGSSPDAAADRDPVQRLEARAARASRAATPPRRARSPARPSGPTRACRRAAARRLAGGQPGQPAQLESRRARRPVQVKIARPEGRAARLTPAAPRGAPRASISWSPSGQGHAAACHPHRGAQLRLAPAAVDALDRGHVHVVAAVADLDVRLAAERAVGGVGARPTSAPSVRAAAPRPTRGSRPPRTPPRRPGGAHR